MNKPVKVFSVDGVDIVFDPLGEHFTVGEESYASLSEAKHAILKSKEKAYEGSFLVSEYDGIEEFTAKQKVFDAYEGEYYIIGVRLRKIGNDRGKYKESQLFPRSKANLELLEEQKRMDAEGWKLIWAAKAIGKKLKK